MAKATERFSPLKRSNAASGWTATRAWDVIEAANETEALAAEIYAGTTATGTYIPVVNDAHPRSALLKAHDPHAENNGGPTVWVVTVEYSIPKDGSRHQGRGAQDNPLDAPIRIQWQIGNTTEPIDRDVSFNPICNSARDPFSQPPSKLYPSTFLTITRWEPYFNFAQYWPYQGHVNSVDFIVPGVGTIGAGEAMMHSIQPASEYEAGSSPLEIRFNMELRPDGHKLRVLDAGRRAVYFDSATSTRRVGPVYQKDGDTLVSEDVRLNGFGRLIDSTTHKILRTGATASDFPTVPDGAEAQNVGSGQFAATFLLWTIYNTIDFNALGFNP